jgi:hypothetical protein
VRRFLLIILGLAALSSACASATRTASATPTAASSAAHAPSPSAGPADAGWYALSPAGDGFTSKFPAQPKLSQSTTTTKFGPAPTSIWEYLANSELDYNLAMWQYPAGSTGNTTAATMYDGAILSMDSANGLTLDTQADVTLNGHTGRAFTVSGSAYKLRGELVLVGDTLYMVYASYGPTIDTTVVDAFLADFAVTD